MATESSSHQGYASLSPFYAREDGFAAPSALLRKLARNAADLLSLDDCVVALLDETGTKLVVLATAQDQPITQERVLPLFQEPLEDLARRREALVLRDVDVDAYLQPLTGDARCTLACVPLLEQAQWRGTLIASTSSSQAFGTEQLRTLELCAEGIMLALHNERQASLVRDANRMKANFLSLVTHELRSPLNTINGYLDLLLEGLAGEINDQQREFLRRARSGSEHLYALLEDLLLASRADAGQLRLNLAPISLNALVTGALEELEMTAQDSQVRLESRLPAGLPQLQADSVRLQQVLRNLLINALRFTPAGGNVMVSAYVIPAPGSEREQMLQVRVSDTGIGIAPRYHQAIFERFFQVPRTEGGRTSGQGLGLAIVKLIIELHGGRVWVESKPDQGSTFLFTLPLAVEA